jgi:hypothetical protein
VTIDRVREAALDVFSGQGLPVGKHGGHSRPSWVSEAEVRRVAADNEYLLEVVLGPRYDDIEALLDSDDLTPEIFLERYVDLSLADRKGLTLTMVDSGTTAAHPTLGPRVRPLAARMLAALGASDEASRVHAWGALAVIESTIAFQPGIEAALMRGPLLSAARGALRGAS